MGEKLMAIEVHLDKRINNVNVVRESDKRNHREHMFVTLLAGLFLLGLLFYGWQHYRWIQYGYRIEEAQKKKDQLEQIARQLRLERASLRNPQRIDAYARRDLGMVVPAPGQMVTLSSDAPLTLPVPQQQTEAEEQLAKR
jgi:cell division protein FtsL